MADLLKPADVFGYLREPTPDDTDPKYKLIDSLITRASDYAERYVKGPIIDQEVTEKLDGTGDTDIEVFQYPVKSLTTVEVDGADVTKAASFYEDGLIYLQNVLFTEGRQNVTVTFKSGYGANMDEIPQDIQQAALLIVHFWYKRDSLDYSDTFGESEIIQGQWRFPTDAVRMLKPYRRYRMAAV